MPHFCSKHEGCDEYLCQACGSTRCSTDTPSRWLDPIPGGGRGNVCPMHFCSQCDGYMANQWILGPVCGDCCRANHRAAVGRR